MRRSLQTLSVHRQDLIASFQTPVRRCRALKSADTQHVYIPSASQHVTSSDRDSPDLAEDCLHVDRQVSVRTAEATDDAEAEPL